MLALKHIFIYETLDVIFLQETLGLGDETVKILESLVAGWCFVVMDTRGKFGGLGMGINQISIKILISWGVEGVLGVNVFVSNLGMEIKLVNIYRPC